MPERKVAYENLKHKADAGFLLKAPSWERLYIDSAHALTDQWVSLDRVKDDSKRLLKVQAKSKETLLVVWLNEIILLYEKQKFLSKRITFQKFTGTAIEATLFGDDYDPLRHGTIPSVHLLNEQQIQMGELHEQDLHFFARVLIKSV